MIIVAIVASADLGRSEVHSQVKHILFPLLERLGAASFATSSAAYHVLVRLHSLLAIEGNNLGGPLSGNPVQVLLTAYADYLVGDIYFQLKFDVSPSGNFRGGLPAVLVAVVQHVGLEMVPFLADVVQSLLKMSPQVANAATAVCCVITAAAGRRALAACYSPPAARRYQLLPASLLAAARRPPLVGRRPPVCRLTAAATTVFRLAMPPLVPWIKTVHSLIRKLVAN